MVAEPGTATIESDRPDGANSGPLAAERATVGDFATQLAEGLADGDVLFLVLEEQRAVV